MYRYACSILGDQEAAGDVVQECLAKIWKKRSILSSIQNHEAWTMRIVRNQCLDWVKVNRFDMLEPKHEKADANASADGLLLTNERTQWMEAILEKMPDKHREVFHLREVEELSYREISEVLSISMEDVKVCIYRARNHIQSHLIKLDEYGIAN